MQCVIYSKFNLKMKEEKKMPKQNHQCFIKIKTQSMIELNVMKKN